GAVQLNPLRVPATGSTVFAIESSQGSGTPIQGTLNDTSLALSGIRFRAPGLFNESFDLQPLTISATGDFSEIIGPASVTIPATSTGFHSLANVQFTLARASGLWSLKNFTGDITLPGFSQKPTLSGIIASDGTFNLASSAAVTLNFTGLQVESLAT